jgi:hypothetical protein
MKRNISNLSTQFTYKSRPHVNNKCQLQINWYRFQAIHNCIPMFNECFHSTTTSEEYDGHHTLTPQYLQNTFGSANPPMSEQFE